MIRKIFLISSILAVLGSCTKDYDTINIDPNSPAIVPLDYLLGQTQLQIAGSAGDPGYATWRANLIYALPTVQQFSSLSTFYAGDKYLYQADLSEAYFVTQYPSSVKNLVNLITLAGEKPEDVNIQSIARILKVFQMHLITDLYGDVPYSEAGQGFFENNFSPKYDPQQEIYADMLKELDEAAAALTSGQRTPTAADFVYGGNIESWRKFAYSLMLRLGMRMTKADIGSAETWVKKALAGGVMSSNAETFEIHHSDGPTSSMNSNSFNLGPPSRNEVLKGSIQWSKTLIDMMKARTDPRISVISQLKNGDVTAAAQKGLPNGFDATSLQAATGEIGADNYSIPRDIIYNVDDPNMFMTHAEARFLTAEAIARGWGAGSAAAEFAAGQAAALSQLADYDAGGAATISPVQIAAYQAANVYPGGTLDAQMTAIHTEMFILTASTLNGYEAWSNWRRTGIPVLTPTTYTGNQTNGQIMRRLRYPQGEEGVNGTNYADAVSRMGGDTFTSRVWWDKP